MMSQALKIADAVLYEGYLLYPYRQSALKNLKRFNFGVLAPRAWAEKQINETFFQKTEILLESELDEQITLINRFLQPTVEVNGKGVIERKIEHKFCLRSVLSAAETIEFEFSPANQAPNFAKIWGTLNLVAKQLTEKLFKLTVTIENKTAFAKNDLPREAVLSFSFVSTHALLFVEKARFVSLLEPPEDLRKYVQTCENVNVFPVLVGDNETRQAILSSPIILYDFPQIAPESPITSFDLTEIDEILVLRALTLTEDEKLEIARSDERGRILLETLENLSPDQLLKLHGAARIIGQ